MEDSFLIVKGRETDSFDKYVTQMFTRPQYLFPPLDLETWKLG